MDSKTEFYSNTKESQVNSKLGHSNPPLWTTKKAGENTFKICLKIWKSRQSS